MVVGDKAGLPNETLILPLAFKKIEKFGDAAGLPAGPDSNATYFGEAVILKMSIIRATDEEDETKIKQASEKSKIVCRICFDNHWTAKCPFKDSEMAQEKLDIGTDADDEAAAKAASGKYVPPSLRAGARREGGGESMASDRRDDYATIRITNLSEDVQEHDLKELVGRFGMTARVFVARHMGSNFCKGFAFVSFYSKSDAEKAIATLNGYGYDNLILNVEWAMSNEKKPLK